MKTLEELRAELDAFDTALVSLLDKRLQIVDQIAEWKRGHHHLIEDPEREHKVLAHVKEAATHLVLKEMIEEIYQPIIKCCKVSQMLSCTSASPFAKIGIIGLGLIGGSIIKTIKAKAPHIEISSLLYDSPDLEPARASHLVDRWEKELDQLCKHADLIILAVPPKDVTAYASKIGKMAFQDSSLIVIDVAGVKGSIVRMFERFASPILEFVGTHPMSGKETSGFSHSSSILFAGAPWIITPHAKNTSEALDQVSHFLAFLGANPIRLDAETHDECAALVSQLPGLISEKLYQFVKQSREESLSLAGPGFKSMTRLAHDNPDLRQEVIRENQSMQGLLKKWIAFLQEKK